MEANTLTDTRKLTEAILRAHSVPRDTGRWKDYETAKHYIELQQWGDRTQYAQALRVACEWVGV
jgi:hypothetical protein